MTTPLLLAVNAWNRNVQGAVREDSIEDALALRDTGMFSTRNIILITGLPEDFTYDLLKKTDRTGGRLNPECLSDILDIRTVWQDAQRSVGEGYVDSSVLKRVVVGGCSLRLVAKLTEIPFATVQRAAARA